MRKVYRFDTINQLSITLDELQPEPAYVVLRVHSNDDLLVLQFEKQEFEELCNMKYRLDFPPASVPVLPLALVAA